MLNCAIFLFGSLVLIKAADVYVDQGYPFQAGPLKVQQIPVTKIGNGSPLDSIIIHPVTPGTYAIFFFVPGFNGVLRSAYYTEYLTGVAQHGFIVISADLSFGDEKEAKKRDRGFHFGDLYVNQIKWMQKNLAIVLNATSSSGVVGSWDHLGLGSHSAGADSAVYIAVNHPEMPKALSLMGPYATNLRKAVNFSVPILLVQSELSTHHKGIMPPCMNDRFGYKHIWDLWPHPPRVRMQVKGFGHCGLCNKAIWEECYKTQACVTTQNVSSIPSYLTFTEGLTSAFFAAYITGYDANLKYVINQTLFKEPVLDFCADV
ncbi:hypothetical protein V1264_002935 [Littorina saxatilis]|uniref:Chlorophyllase n=1 Tax=Littorina saxatilis TaxID=31220 RepID=A0AAN9G8P2_9CAEN